MATAVMLVCDCTDPPLLEAFKRALSRLATLLALQAAPGDELRFGMCSLAGEGGRVKLQARRGPGPP